MKKKIATIVLALLILFVPMYAQFGLPIIGGITVNDPLHQASNLVQFVAVKANQAAQYAKTVEHIAKTVEHINWTVTHYKAFVYQTTQIPGKWVRWATAMVSLRPTSAYDTYGVNSGWLGAINKGLKVADGYASKVERLSTPPGSIYMFSRDQLRYSNIEMADGINQRALSVIGDYRSNLAQRQAAVEVLEKTSLNEVDQEQTQTAILQKISAGNVIQTRMTNDSNELLSTFIEMQVTKNTADRDAQAHAMNDEMYRRANAPGYMAQQAAKTTEALQKLAIP